MFNILYLYNATQTYTNTVYEHIASFARYSGYRSFFCHQDANTELSVELSRFDVVALHYSVRLPYDQISPSTAEALKNFKGLKFLFIQDEYDHTHRAWYWMRQLGFQLVFSVVPGVALNKIYPAEEFPNTRFVSVLTGYVPDGMEINSNLLKPSERTLVVGYRGRPLPIRYGQLGFEKVAVGEMVKRYCDLNGVRNDIAWTEESRIYGQGWYAFMESCRSMLGVESGSNVFDWDGKLGDRIVQLRLSRPDATDREIYEELIEPEEMPGVMNQVSPRIFEAISARTVLVLFEGEYSGVVEAGVHFIPLKKDGSNLEDVVRLLQNDAYVDEMADRAFRDVIASGKYSYKSFVRHVDAEVAVAMEALELPHAGAACVSINEKGGATLTPITTLPIRAQLNRTGGGGVPGPSGIRELTIGFAMRVERILPESARNVLKPRIKRLLGVD